MEESLQFGHMSIASEVGAYFLPHHAAFKTGSDNKTRVVLDDVGFRHDGTTKRTGWAHTHDSGRR